MVLKTDLLDAREPFRFLGLWDRSLPYIHDSPAVDKDFDEPHAKRRIAILGLHPEIRKLYGKCPKTFLILIFAIFLHAVTSNFIINLSYPYMIFLSFFFGGSICQLMGVIIHEATHDLVFSNSFLNTICLFLANIPLPVPIAASFKRYHLEHHAFQGTLPFFYF